MAERNWGQAYQILPGTNIWLVSGAPLRGVRRAWLGEFLTFIEKASKLAAFLLAPKHGADAYV